MSVTADMRPETEPTTSEARAFSDYIELLDRMHCHLLPRTYAEIGVSCGKSLAQSLPGTRALGVDPDPHISWRVPRSAKVFPLSSDDFFQQYEPEDVFGGTPLDLAFIDGMHLFEFALRDFMNLEKWCGKDSVIVVHDCYPIDRTSASRVRTTSAWTGDVWKLVLCLKEFRPDLNVATVDVPPSGLCVITGLDPTSRVLEANYDAICERFIPLDYSIICEGTFELLNRVPNDWAAVTRLLPLRRFREANVGQLRLVRSLRIPQRTVLPHAIKRSVPPLARRVLRDLTHGISRPPGR
jgi:hypothetical protein